MASKAAGRKTEGVKSLGKVEKLLLGHGNKATASEAIGGGLVG